MHRIAFTKENYLSYYSQFLELWKLTKIPYHLVRAMICRQIVAAIMDSDEETQYALIEMIDWFDDPAQLRSIQEKLTKKIEMPKTGD